MIEWMKLFLLGWYYWLQLSYLDWNEWWIMEFEWLKWCKMAYDEEGVEGQMPALAGCKEGTEFTLLVCLWLILDLTVYEKCLHHWSWICLC